MRSSVNVPPTGGGKLSIAPVVPIGYRPAWDQYRDDRGRSQQVTDDGYFYYDSAGVPRAFRLRELYKKAVITDLYGANIIAIVELWPGARKGNTFRPWEVGRWLMAAAVDVGIIEPKKLGFLINPRGRWTAGPFLARADRRSQ